MAGQVHKVTDLYLQRCASTAVCALAEDITLGWIWAMVRGAYPGSPSRGEVALCVRLAEALNPPAGSGTPGDVSNWTAKGLKILSSLEEHLAVLPANLVALQPGIDLPAPGMKHLLEPLHFLRIRLGNERFQQTVHGGQVATSRKYFLRSMELLWRGMRIENGDRASAALVRAHFGQESYRERDVKRDVGPQPLPGSVSAWGAGLDEEAWKAALAEMMALQARRNSAERGRFSAHSCK